MNTNINTGVSLTRNVTLTKHITHICECPSKRLDVMTGLQKRNRDYKSIKVKYVLFVIRPLLECAYVLWDDYLSPHSSSLPLLPSVFHTLCLSVCLSPHVSIFLLLVVPFGFAHISRTCRTATPTLFFC